MYTFLYERKSKNVPACNICKNARDLQVIELEALHEAAKQRQTDNERLVS